MSCRSPACIESFNYLLAAATERKSQTPHDSPYPSFVEKVRAVVGLFLNLPDHETVLSVDENNLAPQ